MHQCVCKTLEDHYNRSRTDGLVQGSWCRPRNQRNLHWALKNLTPSNATLLNTVWPDRPWEPHESPLKPISDLSHPISDSLHPISDWNPPHDLIKTSPKTLESPSGTRDRHLKAPCILSSAPSRTHPKDLETNEWALSLDQCWCQCVRGLMPVVRR